VTDCFAGDRARMLGGDRSIADDPQMVAKTA